MPQTLAAFETNQHLLGITPGTAVALRALWPLLQPHAEALAARALQHLADSPGGEGLTNIDIRGLSTSMTQHWYGCCQNGFDLAFVRRCERRAQTLARSLPGAKWQVGLGLWLVDEGEALLNRAFPLPWQARQRHEALASFRKLVRMDLLTQLDALERLARSNAA